MTGVLDLVVARYMVWDFDDIYCGHREEGFRSYCHPDLFKPASVLLYHNDGNGKFSEVSAKAGIDKPGKGLGLAIADYDHDGWMDILLANDSIPELICSTTKEMERSKRLGCLPASRWTAAGLPSREWAWISKTIITTAGPT